MKKEKFKTQARLDQKTHTKLIRMASKMKVNPNDLLDFLCDIGIPAGWNVELVQTKLP